MSSAEPILVPETETEMTLAPESVVTPEITQTQIQTQKQNKEAVVTTIPFIKIHQALKYANMDVVLLGYVKTLRTGKKYSFFELVLDF